MHTLIFSNKYFALSMPNFGFDHVMIFDGTNLWFDHSEQQKIEVSTSSKQPFSAKISDSQFTILYTIMHNTPEQPIALKIDLHSDGFASLKISFEF